MRALRGLLVLAAVVAVAVAYLTRGSDEPAGPDVPANAVRLTFAYSSNLEDMMATLLPRFNAERHSVGGRPIFVTGVAAASGEAQTKIAAGKLRPHVWSPASSLWGRLLNYSADATYVADENPSLASSPVVIAMWQPLAEALGWPDKEIGFTEILELATPQSD